MNPTILKAIEDSSPSEVILPSEFIEASVIKELAKLRPDLESLTIEYVGDDALKYLSLFPKLKKLFITETACLSRDGSWLDSVTSLSRLTHLAIHSYQDIGLAFLQNLSQLENLIDLDLNCCDRIDDDNVHIFSKFKNLRFLNLNNSDYLTDNGMPHIASLIHLEGLEFAYTTFVSNQGLQLLSSLKNLKYLDLGGTKISDEGLKILSSLSNLELLCLHDCQTITKKGFLHLQNFPKLRQIYARTLPQATEEVIQQMPSLQIIRDNDFEAWSFWYLKVKEYKLNRVL